MFTIPDYSRPHEGGVRKSSSPEAWEESGNRSRVFDKCFPVAREQFMFFRFHHREIKCGIKNDQNQQKPVTLACHDNPQCHEKRSEIKRISTIGIGASAGESPSLFDMPRRPEPKQCACCSNSASNPKRPD